MSKVFFLLLTFTAPLFCEPLKRNICVFTINSLYGEREFANRIVLAAHNLGWDATTYNIESDLPFNDENLDFIIDLSYKAHLIPTKKMKYLPILERKRFIDRNGLLKENAFHYAGYLSLFNKSSKMEQQFKKLRKPLFMIKWFPTVHEVPYKEVNPAQLAYTYCNWGNRGNDERYIELTRLLSKQEYFHLFGGKAAENQYPESYQGSIPFDGESLLDAFNERGITLVIHSQKHNPYKIPSARIFEAAAASTVIISDRNEFVLKNFGDSVLYFDHTKSGKEMFQQIHKHMNWILAHPDLAQDKAKKAHEIYKKRFVLEDQLLELSLMHEKVKA